MLDKFDMCNKSKKKLFFFIMKERTMKNNIIGKKYLSRRSVGKRYIYSFIVSW